MLDWRVVGGCVLAGLISAVPRPVMAQENTQGGPGAGETTATAVANDQPQMSFDEQSKILTGVFPIALDHMEQVAQNSFNWRGIRDASMACELGFTPQAIVVRGKALDDQPFVQPIAYPDKPDWWETTYAADGLELILEDPTSSTNRLRLILNYSSAGLAPKVQVQEAPLVKTAGVLTSADFRIKALQPEDVPTNLPDRTTPVAGFRFEAAIPTSGLAEPKFFSGSLRMTIRLHDLDGGMDTYLRMDEVIEKRDQ